MARDTGQGPGRVRGSGRPGRGKSLGVCKSLGTGGGEWDGTARQGHGMEQVPRSTRAWEGGRRMGRCKSMGGRKSLR